MIPLTKQRVFQISQLDRTSISQQVNFNTDTAERLLKQHLEERETKCMANFLRDRITFDPKGFRDVLFYRDIHQFYKCDNIPGVFMLYTIDQNTQNHAFESYKCQNPSELSDFHALVSVTMTDKARLLRDTSRIVYDASATETNKENQNTSLIDRNGFTQDYSARTNGYITTQSSIKNSEFSRTKIVRSSPDLRANIQDQHVNGLNEMVIVRRPKQLAVPQKAETMNVIMSNRENNKSRQNVEVISVKAYPTTSGTWQPSSDQRRWSFTDERSNLSANSSNNVVFVDNKPVQRTSGRNVVLVEEHPITRQQPQFRSYNNLSRSRMLTPISSYQYATPPVRSSKYAVVEPNQVTWQRAHSLTPTSVVAVPSRRSNKLNLSSEDFRLYRQQKQSRREQLNAFSSKSQRLLRTKSYESKPLLLSPVISARPVYQPSKHQIIKHVVQAAPRQPSYVIEKTKSPVVLTSYERTNANQPYPTEQWIPQPSEIKLVESHPVTLSRKSYEKPITVVKAQPINEPPRFTTTKTISIVNKTPRVERLSNTVVFDIDRSSTNRVGSGLNDAADNLDSQPQTAGRYQDGPSNRASLIHVDPYAQNGPNITDHGPVYMYAQRMQHNDARS